MTGQESAGAATTPYVLTPNMRARIETITEAGYDRWRVMVERIGGCEEPVRLVGTSHRADPRTGEILTEYTTNGHEPGYLLVACGNRRASRCEPCSRVYKADTYHLVRAGLSGGKGVPESVRDHPRVFVTLTAPSFGVVHHQRTGKDGKPAACLPRRGNPHCAHGVPLGCHARHDADDSRLGEPLCPHCYDYTGAVLWNAHAGELWRRTTVYLRAELAKLAGLSRKRLTETARLSYVKVAEFQARGLVHFHVVIRLDGPDGPTTPAPFWCDTELITAGLLAVVPHVAVRRAEQDGEGARVFPWGEQLDIRPVATADGDDQPSEQAVSGYIAKYATKAAEATGTVDRRIRSAEQVPMLRVSDHARSMIETAWQLGRQPEYADLKLHQWSHMLGYRGHFSTKSRAYSTTLGTLRAARADYRAQEHAADHGLPKPEQTVTIGTWSYVGTGYRRPGETLIAEDIRNTRRQAREDRQQRTA